MSTLNADAATLVAKEVATKDLHRAGRTADPRVLSTRETVALEGTLCREVGASISLLEAFVALDVAAHKEAAGAETKGERACRYQLALLLCERILVGLRGGRGLGRGRRKGSVCQRRR